MLRHSPPACAGGFYYGTRAEQDREPHLSLACEAGEVVLHVSLILPLHEFGTREPCRWILLEIERLEITGDSRDAQMISL